MGTTGKQPPKNHRRGVPAVRLPHPNEYFTDSGFTWTLTLVGNTPAAAGRAEPGQSVNGFIGPPHWPQQGMMVCSDVGALGFAPPDTSAEIKKLAEEIGQAGGGGFRRTGVCKFSGKTLSCDGEIVTVQTNDVASSEKGRARIEDHSPPTAQHRPDLVHTSS